MSEAAPTGWELVSLKEGVSKLISGQSPNRKENPAKGNAYGILKTTAVDWGKFDETHNQEVLDDFDHNEGHLVKKGDVLITKAGPEHRVGVVALVKEVRGNMLVSGKMTSIRVNNKISPDYLAYALCHEHAQKHLKASTTGMASSQTNFTHEALLDVPVLLPPLKEQHKIAEILTSVDEVIENTQSQIDKLEDLKKATMNELLTKGIGHTEFKETEIGRIPKSWVTYKITDVADVIDSLHQTPQFISRGLPMVRVTDIKPGNINLVNTQKVTESDYEQFTKKYRPVRGDILITRVGSYGVTSFVETNEKFCIGQNTAIINPKKIHSKYLYYFLNSLTIKNYIESEVAGSGYKSLSLGSIRDLPISAPKTTEQEEIASILSAIDNYIDETVLALNRIKKLKMSLMQDLLTGTVRVFS